MAYSSNFDIGTMLLSIPGVLLALVLHEWAHAKAADLLGDPTPRLRGRLSLDPRVHLDFLGTFLFFFFGFGWAKPVPVTPARLRNPHWGDLMVAAAGPLMNVVVAIALGLLLRLLAGTALGTDPLVVQLVFYAFMLNIYLAAFNLIPLPPLDGWWILRRLAPGFAVRHYRNIEAFGPLILVLLLITGLGRTLMQPLVRVVTLVVSSVAGI